ncbi:MAG: hypothetical protein IJ834_01270 [Paludibacteraceae bacterium]|nr:hypothetical protein [Paludibacteraceae bacterium]
MKDEKEINEIDEIEFNEEDAIRYIRNFIPEQDQQGLTDDDIQYVLDEIYEYYESKGLIDDDTAEEASIDEEEMLNFILKDAQDDDIKISSEQIQLIVEGEYEYGVSIGIYQPQED